jgi:hypothetical protein
MTSWRRLRSRRAVSAAVAVARHNGLRVAEPAVLADLFSLMVHLRPAPVGGPAGDLHAQAALADRRLAGNWAEPVEITGSAPYYYPRYKVGRVPSV